MGLTATDIDLLLEIKHRKKAIVNIAMRPTLSNSQAMRRWRRPISDGTSS